MNEKAQSKLRELKGKLQGRIFLARADADRAEATISEMTSGYYMGYYRSEADTYRRCACQLEEILADLCDAIQEAQNG